ncbi:DUF4367 domain-containing protein [Desulfolucanica intricata]|uniref:DUF4367 domain-containing protein n=1 Tax=Desulfolucanica intricata TaxID=1285191 RepID=UPI00082F70C9|nr:DUF4367 domain-containing protein [Desulfolucanica intricata]
MGNGNSHEYTSVDELIKKALYKQAEKDSDIDLEEAWSKFNKRYRTNKQKPVLKLLATACLICTVLGSIIFFLPTEGGAFTSKIFKNIKLFLSGKVQSTEISYGSPGQKEKTENYLKPEVLRTLEDVPYNVLLPVDMMGNYEIEEINTNKLGNSTELNIILTGKNSESIIITEINTTKGFRQGSSYDIEDAQMKNVKVKGQDAALINYKNKLLSLSWVDNDIFISIEGNISQDDILMLSNSMKRIDYLTK